MLYIVHLVSLLTFVLLVQTPQHSVQQMYDARTIIHLVIILTGFKKHQHAG